MSLLDAVGWFGSALLVFSLMQARVLRFRIINTVACVIPPSSTACSGSGRWSR